MKVIYLNRSNNTWNRDDDFKFINHIDDELILCEVASFLKNLYVPIVGFNLQEISKSIDDNIDNGIIAQQFVKPCIDSPLLEGINLKTRILHSNIPKSQIIQLIVYSNWLYKLQDVFPYNNIDKIDLSFSDISLNPLNFEIYNTSNVSNTCIYLKKDGTFEVNKIDKHQDINYQSVLLWDRDTKTYRSYNKEMFEVLFNVRAAHISSILLPDPINYFRDYIQEVNTYVIRGLRDEFVLDKLILTYYALITLMEYEDIYIEGNNTTPSSLLRGFKFNITMTDTIISKCMSRHHLGLYDYNTNNGMGISHTKNYNPIKEVFKIIWSS